ncbi:unnamed protein product, partial [Iphiclides podalirius]
MWDVSLRLVKKSRPRQQIKLSPRAVDFFPGDAPIHLLSSQINKTHAFRPGFEAAANGAVRFINYATRTR